MKRSTHLSWEEVVKRADGEPIFVHYDGIQRGGYCWEKHMVKMFRDCELMQLTLNDYMVTKWPERREK